MNILRLLPVFLSALLLGAHFLRTELILPVIFALLFPALLLFKRAWAARLVQIILVLGSLEWVRTLIVLVAERRAYGLPWIRLAIIIGGVAIFTGSSALLLSYCRSLRNKYRLDNSF